MVGWRCAHQALQEHYHDRYDHEDESGPKAFAAESPERIFRRLMGEHGMTDVSYQVARTYVQWRRPEIRIADSVLQLRYTSRASCVRARRMRQLARRYRSRWDRVATG